MMNPVTLWNMLMYSAGVVIGGDMDWLYAEDGQTTFADSRYDSMEGEYHNMGMAWAMEGQYLDSDEEWYHWQDYLRINHSMIKYYTQRPRPQESVDYRVVAEDIVRRAMPQ